MDGSFVTGDLETRCLKTAPEYLLSSSYKQQRTVSYQVCTLFYTMVLLCVNAVVGEEIKTRIDINIYNKLSFSHPFHCVLFILSHSSIQVTKQQAKSWSQLVTMPCRNVMSSCYKLSRIFISKFLLFECFVKTLSIKLIGLYIKFESCRN